MKFEKKEIYCIELSKEETLEFICFCNDFEENIKHTIIQKIWSILPSYNQLK